MCSPRWSNASRSCRRPILTSRNPCSSFFFSSRRRHTRFDCDWSSDVCSSDLREPGRRRHHHFPAAVALEVGHRQLRPEVRSEEHTSELQSQSNLVCRLLLEKKKKNMT